MVRIFGADKGAVVIYRRPERGTRKLAPHEAEIAALDSTPK